MTINELEKGCWYVDASGDRWQFVGCCPYTGHPKFQDPTEAHPRFHHGWTFMVKEGDRHE